MSSDDTVYPKVDGFIRTYDTDDRADQLVIQYLTEARVAAGLENNESQEGEGKPLSISVDEAWARAGSYIQALVQTNPHKVLETGLFLTMMPRNSAPHRESINQWLRGDGPLLLADDRVRPFLVEYLNTDESGTFCELAYQYMMHDIIRYSRDEAFEQAECFLAVAIMYLCAKLQAPRGNLDAVWLHDTALVLLRNPQISRVVRYYRDIPGTVHMIEEMEPYLAREDR